jgi:hypothetical protein
VSVDDATVSGETSARLRTARERLAAACAAVERARAEDLQLASPATAAVLENAMRELTTASRSLTELIATIYRR